MSVKSDIEARTAALQAVLSAVNTALVAKGGAAVADLSSVPAQLAAVQLCASVEIEAPCHRVGVVGFDLIAIDGSEKTVEELQPDLQPENIVNGKTICMIPGTAKKLRAETGTWIPASSDVHTAVLPCSVDPKIVIATTADETPGAKNKILSFFSESISGALRNTVLNVLTPQGTLGGSTTAADFSQGYELYTTYDFALTGYVWMAYYWDA